MFDKKCFSVKTMTNKSSFVENLIIKISNFELVIKDFLKRDKRKLSDYKLIIK